MNRMIFTVAGVFSASSLLLVDSAVKGTALLLLAAIAALILRRDSAATRHLVWLLALVAMLVVPVLSALLPQWRVLPEWAGISPNPNVTDRSVPTIDSPGNAAVELPQNAEPVEVAQPSATAFQPSAGIPDSRPALVTRESESSVWSWNWINALPLVWAIGFSGLLLRLMAARLMLWNSERQGTVIWSSRQPAQTPHDPIITAIESAYLQLRMRRRVALLIHPEKTIPVVWGIVRSRLLLPAAARHWGGEQLQSVLLHELAHVKRRDTMTQLLVQIACALHWFNPLVWFAAWRLSVERERACDDLVLASGVRPSSYAAHLLEVVTGLSPSRWTRACGLAMARKSSLEGRLAAVLSESLNRRGISVALASIALAIGVGIAVPIAMLHAADEKWNPPQAAHISTNNFSTYCVHDGKNASFVVAYRGSFSSSSDHASTSKTRTWHDAVTLTLKTTTLNKEVALRREHTAPDQLTLAGKDYDLTKGRVFLVSNDGESIRQLAINASAIENGNAAGALARRIAAILPQEREQTGPKHESAQSLFKRWQDSARTDGKIPGGALKSLARAVANFIKLNPTHERVPQLTEVLKRIDASHDWTQTDAVALLNDLSDIYPTLPDWAGSEERFSIHPGTPLPAELLGAPWGQAAANGLRAAWFLEPVAAQHPLGANLKARILFHNTGKEMVLFRTPDWHQYATHKARDAKGAAIEVSATEWTRLSTLVPIRLAPGEYAEVEAHAIGVGARNKSEENWEGLRVGAWIEAKDGDEITFQPAAVTASEDRWTAPAERKPATEQWKAIVRERIDREAPMPNTAADREQLLRRVTPDLIGVPPSQEEIAAFVADNSPDALTSLLERLVPRIAPFAGDLPAGEIKFRVTAADPDAAKKPRVASSPGWYTLGDRVRLSVARKSDGNRRVNEASIQFFSPDPKAEPPGKPHEIKLPDGYLTWAAAWERGSSVLWVIQKGLVRSYDFTNPAQVKETKLDEPYVDKLPKPIMEAFAAALSVPGAPVQQQAPLKPRDGAKLNPATEQKLEWGEPVNGLRMALAWPPALGEPAAGDQADFYLAVLNSSQAPVRLCTTAGLPDERWLDLKDKERILFRVSSKEPTGADVTLQPREAVFLRLFPEAATQADARGAHIASSVRQSPNYRLKASLKVAESPAGAWSGTLVTPDTRAGVGAEAPKNRKAQELFKVWLNRARLSGKIPGGFIARLGEHVKTFVKGNATDAAGAPYAKRMEPLLSRLDGTRDWQPVEAATLLNDIAAVSDAPLSVMLEEIARGKVQHGLPFQPVLETAPWGKPVGHGNGLRTATLVGPGIEPKLQYVDWIGNVITNGRDSSDKAGVDASSSDLRLGTPLGCRILIHNTGEEPVVFRTRTWHHIEPTAKDANGAEIAIESVTRLSRAPLVTFRLDPGRYIELSSPGFGLGKYGFHDFKIADIATWIGAKEGDVVTLTPGVLPLQDWNEVEVLNGEPRWWLDFITARLNLVAPLPADPAERKELLNQAMSDLFRQDIRPTEAETAAFLSDTSPEALTNLAVRLHHRPGLRSWAGPLQSGPTKFRVLPADPKAAKPPEGRAAELTPGSPARKKE